MIIKQSNNIVFSYQIDTLFGSCCQKSAYISRHISTEDIVIDDVTLTDDDKNIFLIALEPILSNIHDRLLKLSSGINNAYTNDGTTISFAIQDNGAYNNNVLSIVDTTIYNCMEIGSIMTWYQICGIKAVDQEYSAKYIASLQELSRRIFQLKKKSIKSTLGDITYDTPTSQPPNIPAEDNG